MITTIMIFTILNFVMLTLNYGCFLRADETNVINQAFLKELVDLQRELKEFPNGSR